MFVNIKEAVETFAKHLASENMKLMKARGGKYQRDVQTLLMVTFINKMAELMLTDILEEKPKELIDKQEVEKYIGENYIIARQMLQEGLADAFGTALSDYSGRKAEYYCQIRPVPSPLNKLPC